MRFTHIDVNFDVTNDLTKNPQNVHRNYFWAVLLTFIFDIKIDINICEPHYVNLFFLWTSSIVCMFDFLIFDIFLTTWHLFDILTHQLNLDHLSLHRAILSKIPILLCRCMNVFVVELMFYLKAKFIKIVTQVGIEKQYLSDFKTFDAKVCFR